MPWVGFRPLLSSRASPSGTKCLKNQPYDVIKMREMRGEGGKKTPKKEMDNPHFYDVTWLIFEILCPTTILGVLKL